MHRALDASRGASAIEITGQISFIIFLVRLSNEQERPERIEDPSRGSEIDHRAERRDV